MIYRRFDENLSGLEQSLEEFEYVARKFKREKSDIQIMKDTILANVEKIEQKHQTSSVAIDNLAHHCAKITELLSIINDIKKSRPFE